MRSALRMLATIGVVLVSLYVVACGALFVTQRSLIYYPQPRANTTASSIVRMQVGQTTALVSVHAHAEPGAVIYFGGSAEDVSQDVPDLTKAFPYRALYLLHYPGYGGSSGSPTQKAIFANALALFDLVHAEHADTMVIGRSLGSGVAVWTASQRLVSGLVLITPFDSLGDAAQHAYPFLPVRWLLLDRYQSWRYAPEVKAPTQIIVAERDDLVPRSSTERLRTRFKDGLVSETMLARVGHNTVQDDPSYWKVVSGGQ